MLAGGDVLGVLHVGTYAATTLHRAGRRPAPTRRRPGRPGQPGPPDPGRPGRHAGPAAQPATQVAYPARTGIDLAARYVPGHRSASAATGTTCSRSRRDTSASSWVTSPATDCAPPSSWAGSVAPYAPTPWSTTTPPRSSPDSTARSLTSRPGTWRPCSTRCSPRPRDRLLITSAGHPPPVLAAPRVAPCPLVLPTDAPVGAGWRRPRHSTTIDLPRSDRPSCSTPTGWSNGAAKSSIRASPAVPGHRSRPGRSRMQDGHGPHGRRRGRGRHRSAASHRSST